MKDIYTILGEIGLTVPEEKKSAFDTAVRENYKTVSEHDRSIETVKKNAVSDVPFKKLFCFDYGSCENSDIAEYIFIAPAFFVASPCIGSVP